MTKEQKDFAIAAYWSAVAGTLIGLGLAIFKGVVKGYVHIHKKD